MKVKGVKDVIRVFWRIYVEISPATASRVLYYYAYHKKINLNKPKLFDEKLMYLKLYKYNNNPLITQCIDKYKVRQYLEKKGCSLLLNDLVGVWDNVNDIDWDSLPNQFVLKCNHGCKFNIICDDKSQLDIGETKQKLNKWMKTKFWNELAEINYKNIPHKIICEKYLDTNDGFLPNDYKIYCFDGVPKLVLVCTERESKLKLSFFDLDWNPLNIGVEPCNTEIKMPISFALMLEASEKLTQGFPFVRVDFYQYGDKPIFGEMTFTPAACVAKYYNEYGQKILGEMLNIK